MNMYSESLNPPVSLGLATSKPRYCLDNWRYIGYNQHCLDNQRFQQRIRYRPSQAQIVPTDLLLESAIQFGAGYLDWMAGNHQFELWSI